MMRVSRLIDNLVTVLDCELGSVAIWPNTQPKVIQINIRELIQTGEGYVWYRKPLHESSVRQPSLVRELWTEVVD